MEENNSGILSMRANLLNERREEVQIESGNNNYGKKGLIIEEIKKQAWLAGPLVSVNLMLFSLQLISIMFVGHLGELPLSGASMATSFASVTGFSLLVSNIFFLPLSLYHMT